MRSVTLLSGLVICSLLVACGPSAPTPTPTPEPMPTPVEVLADKIEDIVGVWVCGTPNSAYGGTLYVEFLADGTYQAASSLPLLQTSPIKTGGEFWFEGDVLTDKGGWCKSGQGTYQVWLVQQGGETVALRWKIIEDDDCYDRRACYYGLTKTPRGQ